MECESRGVYQNELNHHSFDVGGWRHFQHTISVAECPSCPSRVITPCNTRLKWWDIPFIGIELRCVPFKHEQRNTHWKRNCSARWAHYHLLWTLITRSYSYSLKHIEIIDKYIMHIKLLITNHILTYTVKVYVKYPIMEHFLQILQKRKYTQFWYEILRQSVPPQINSTLFMRKFVPPEISSTLFSYFLRQCRANRESTVKMYICFNNVVVVVKS